MVSAPIQVRRRSSSSNGYALRREAISANATTTGTVAATTLASTLRPRGPPRSRANAIASAVTMVDPDQHLFKHQQLLASEILLGPYGGSDGISSVVRRAGVAGRPRAPAAAVRESVERRGRLRGRRDQRDADRPFRRPINLVAPRGGRECGQP
jgi:hypothetical protein